MLSIIKKHIIHPIKRWVAKIYLVFLRRFFGLKVIAITGSMGKTTTKELLLSLLSQLGPTVASYANIDSVYNIPTTILKCTPKTKYLVLEMGVEYPGEMNFYTWMANPDIAAIISVNITHTQFMKNIKNIAYEKGLIAKRMDKKSTLVINASDKNIWIKTKARVVKVKPLSAKINPDLTTTFGKYTLPVVAPHLSPSLSIAVKIAEISGASPTQIKNGIMQTKLAPHRMQPIRLKNGGLIIDDVYNANPKATQEAILTLDHLSKMTKRVPVLVFGQMNELGDLETIEHQKIKDLINKLKIKHVITRGPATKGIGIYCETNQQVLLEMQPFLNDNYLILMKSSRGWKMEEVINDIFTKRL
jgi:UDP-N-acetylmuramoyl-tripeptide--D-alanyl-D-alanine ligase